jgi:hypothetical protein
MAVLYEVKTSRMATQNVTYHIEAQSEEEAIEIVLSDDCPLDVGLPVTIPWSREEGDEEVIEIRILEGK